jgi:hypothetical protein
MRGAITIKDLAVETNINGNYVVYAQHTQEGHKTPVELRPIPSLVNQMCIVYDATAGQFVPQDLATYVENTPSFENKIREVAGTAELVVEDGSAVVAKVNVYADSTYLPLTDNNAGDQAFATDTNKLYIWDGSAWQLAGAANTGELSEGTNLYFTNARADARAQLKIDALVDSAPGTLDTLNELAAALGDDANFSTTVTNSIATKLPLAGGTLTGPLTVQGNGNATVQWGDTTAIGALSFDTNDNPLIRSYTGKDLFFQTNGSNNRMVILSGGNVGIGTTGPTSRLHLKAPTNQTIQMKLQPGSDTAESEISFVNAAANATKGYIKYKHSLDELGFRTNGVEWVTINNAGDVNVNNKAKIQANGVVRYGNGSTGIGALSYSSNLITMEALSTDTSVRLAPSGTGIVEVFSSQLSIKDDNVGGTVLRLWNTDTGGKNWSMYSSASGNGEGAGHFLWNNGTSVPMIIQGDGDVGIGTTSPTQRLNVHHNTGDSRIEISTNAAGTNKVQLQLTTDRDGTLGYGFVALLNNNGSRLLRIGTNGNSGTDYSIQIDANNNIDITNKVQISPSGINYNSEATTFSSGAALEVWANDLNTSGFVVGNNSGKAHTWLNYTDGNNYITGDSTNNEGATIFRTYFANPDTYNERMRIAAGGNVGIGTNNPQRRFHIHDGGATGLKITNDQSGAGSNDGFDIYVRDDNQGAELVQRENSFIKFYTNNTPRVEITSDGKLKPNAFVLPVATSGPGSPVTGQQYFNTNVGTVLTYDGTEWISSSGAVSANGGTETTYTAGGVSYKSHTFTSSGTFTVSSSGNVDVMVVAGGAAGGGHGGNDGSGGGGAGGMVVQTGVNVTAGSYTVTVGAGGSSVGGATRGNNGSNSSVNISGVTTAVGGGGGGTEGTVRIGKDGGSGGGAGGYGVKNGGLGTNGQGNNGGPCTSPGDGGGGGKGAAGASGTTGTGGVGEQNSYRTGSNIYYAGGGGGSGDQRNSRGSGGGAGGSGGGGGGADATSGSQPGNGGVNTGGGGGGAAGQNYAGATGSGAGGSGIVVIRYAL